jgi:hypothetical protein
VRNSACVSNKGSERADPVGDLVGVSLDSTNWIVSTWTGCRDRLQRKGRDVQLTQEKEALATRHSRAVLNKNLMGLNFRR